MEKHSIGKFIGVLRKAGGLTQQQLADKCNVSNKTVSKWETEETMPDIELIPVLAEIFELSCDELLRGRRVSTAGEAAVNSATTDKQFASLANKVTTNIKIMSILAFALAALGIVLFVTLMFAYLELAAFLTAILLTAVAIILQIVNIILALQKMRFVSDELDSAANKDKTLNSCKKKLYNYSFVSFSACFVMLVIFVCTVVIL